MQSSESSKTEQAISTSIEVENGTRPQDGSSQNVQQGSHEMSTSIERGRDQQYASQWHRRRKRILDRLPIPVQRYSRKIVAWIKGPQPPRIHRISPFLEKVQGRPFRLLLRFPKSVRVGLVMLLFVVWVVLFGVILSKFSLPADIAGYGPPVKLACTTRPWFGAQSCGLDGRNCLPFSNTSFAFACPADCAGAQVLNPYTIGDQQIMYRPLVIGGTPDPSLDNLPVYRGDSFICSAAIHAGILENSRGGCGVVSLVGTRSSFGSIQRNGITSLAFNSTFPLSYTFPTSPAILSSSAQCRDPRWNLLILSTIISTLISLVSTHPLTFFPPIFTILFFQTALASDPAPTPDLPSLASSALSTFLPATLIMAFLYKTTLHRTLSHLSPLANLEKTLLWLAPAWLAALSNSTLSRIPLQRLTPHDIRQQPGAVVALVLIVLVIAAAAVWQAWCLQLEGRLPGFLALYAAIGIGLGILAAIPGGLELRIHHYILALLLLPGTGLQTRASLVWQGLLVGLFVNGVGRWGFASILQTSRELKGDALMGVGSPMPEIVDVVVSAGGGEAIRFVWAAVENGFDGVSVLVNDVERFRSGVGADVSASPSNGAFDGSSTFPAGNTTLLNSSTSDADRSFTYHRRQEPSSSSDVPTYFRFGFVKTLPFGNVVYSDFTAPGVWWPNGTWGGIPQGRS
ncbi:uncharacterized protein EI97DRAFT_497584 [Westerdykella ornata]|uniref:LCCL domain-containing protein n=1 Tax=Westerdykella ornata TaxID=318751 RepID=A0A6A6JW53_WESOR|nr:uncharacterized protein EI97DRAFT_497584 [Westerdykella ornata]KAF2280841.1 hypothetical protein EI97DRAFT_497584 [Westerdykella ornata]